MTRRYDAMILGAGIVGASVALQMQKRGLAVLLIDRGRPGAATSYGNAGMIQTEAIVPYAFPQSLGALLDYALRRKTAAHYHFGALRSLAPNLLRYRRAGRPESVERTIAANIPLFEHCLTEHQALAEEAGVSDVLKSGGWLSLFLDQKSLDDAQETLALERDHGVHAVQISPSELCAMEPALRGGTAGAVHYPEPWHVRDPLDLTAGYVRRFRELGGDVEQGDALRLEEVGRLWSLRTAGGVVVADKVVAALGPWSTDLFSRLGYRVPMFVMRGYHMHFALDEGLSLNRPVNDDAAGYVLSPMQRGVRLATGAEFALRDAEPSPVQLNKVIPKARSLMPLGAQLDPDPWLGCRPCLPDLLPIIGRAPRHKGLWFACGHAHHGLTLAAVTGRLVAEMVTGERPFADPTPYAMDRF